MSGLEMKYFVLKPTGRDDYAYASRRALETYADVINQTNPALSDDITGWLSSTREEIKEETNQ